MGPVLLWFLLLLAPQGGVAPASEALTRALEHLGLEDLDRTEEALGRETDAETATALILLAQQLDSRGERERGVALRRDALRMRLELFGERDPRTLAVVTALLESFLFQGAYVEAAELARARVGRFEPAGAEDVEPLAHLHNLAAASLQMLGELAEAEEHIRFALALMLDHAGPEHPLSARLMGNLANLLGDQGRLREARELALEAMELQIALHGAESVRAARAHTLLARLQQLEGEFAEAEASLRHAERLLRAQRGPEPVYLSEGLRMLGGLALARGDSAGAEAAYREARALIVDVLGPMHPDVVACDVGIGFALHASGRPAEARPVFESAGDAREALYGAAYVLTIQARISQAITIEQSGDLAEAIELMREQLEIVADAPAHQHELETSLRSGLARCLMAAGDLETAQEVIGAALRGVEERYGRESVFLVDPLTRQAQLAQARGAHELAEECARRAMRIAGDQRDRVLGADVERSHHSQHMHYADMGRLVARLCLARGDAHAALVALEETRARTLLDGLLRAERSAVRDGASDPELERLLGREEEARARLRELEARAAVQEQLDPDSSRALRDLAAVARNALSAATAALAERARETTLSARPLDPARIAATLQPDEVLLSLLWSEDLVAWIDLRSSAEGPELRAVVVAEGREDVSRLTQSAIALARALPLDPRRRGGLPPELDGALRRAADGGDLGSARRVFVVPDGPLLDLPCALVFGDLVREPVLLPSATTLAVLRERGARAEPSPRALVLGDPEFGARETSRTRAAGALAELPAARAEAEYVAALLAAAGREVELLTGAGATRDALEAACQDLGLLHLATHGFPGSPQAPFDAALALAHSTGGSDELTLDRLVRRWEGRLDGCQLVVLSACETHSEIGIGTGAFSLALGFFHAGANDVLASLWKVDERATALLMGRFFENLLGLRGELGRDGALAWRRVAPLPQAQALHEAQTWLRTASREDVRAASRRMGLGSRGSGTRSAAEARGVEASTDALRPYADPYFWAGFVLLGR